MSSVLVHIPVEAGTPRRASLEVLSATVERAESSGQEVVALLLGSGAGAAIEAVSAFGPDRILVCDVAGDEIAVNAGLLAKLEAAIGQVGPAHAVFASSESVKDVLGALGLRPAPPGQAGPGFRPQDTGVNT